jgi:hypothetical protein
VIGSLTYMTMRIDRDRSACSRIFLVFGSYPAAPPRPLRGETPDEDAIAEGLPKVERFLGVANDTLSERTYLAGPEISLADLVLVPMIATVLQTPEGRDIVPRFAAAHPPRPALVRGGLVHVPFQTPDAGLWLKTPTSHRHHPPPHNRHPELVDIKLRRSPAGRRWRSGPDR